MITIFKDKKIETSVIATDYVLSQYQHYEKGNIDQRTAIESASFEKVETYVRGVRPNLEEEVGRETFNLIIKDVIVEYIEKLCQPLHEQQV